MGIGHRCEAQRVVDRLGADDQIVVSQQRAAVGELYRRVEVEPPALMTRLELLAVVVGRAEIFAWHPCAQRGWRGPPGLAIEVVQYRAAPVALLRRWRRAQKLHAEGGVVARREEADASGCHG